VNVILKRLSLFGLGLVLTLAVPVRSRSQPAGQEVAHAFMAQRVHPPEDSVKPTPSDEELARMKKDMEKKVNVRRQAELERDTERLLQLATELKQYVDKSNKDVLSLEVIKKSEEIERLARSVKEKMKGSN
jgi:hypothetical protein